MLRSTEGEAAPPPMFLQRRLGMKTQKQLAATIIATLSFFVFGLSVSFAQSTRTDNQIGYYQQLLNRDPRSARAYYGLGDAWIRKARETGDADYFNRAEAALTKSLEVASKTG